MKIGVISLGCAKNLVDTENLLGILNASGMEIVTDYDEAEAIIINTCGFIESAKTEAIDTILSTADLKENNLKKLIVMGCLSTRYKPQLEEEMPEVDRFISISEYRQLGAILSEELGVKIINSYGKTPRLLSGKPWMAYLRIADGCDNRCSYCAIPLIRGDMHSVPEEELVAEAQRLIAAGVKELNLIAQDSSRYGYDLDGQYDDAFFEENALVVWWQVFPYYNNSVNVPRLFVSESGDTVFVENRQKIPSMSFDVFCDTCVVLSVRKVDIPDAQQAILLNDYESYYHH